MTIESQIEEHIQWAERNNVTIDEFFIDSGYSGTHIKRPSYKRMINRITRENKKGRDGEYKIKYVLLIRYSSRLIRNLMLKRSLVKVFEMYNVEVVCMDGSKFHDTENVDLAFCADIISLTDEVEARRIPKRVEASYKGSASIGNYPIGGYAPRGFMRIKNKGKGTKIVPLEGAEEIAEKLYEMVASNKYTLEQIRKFMNEEQIFGYKWRTKDEVYKFFINPINYGALILPFFNSEEDWKEISASNLENWYDPVNHIHTKPLVSKEKAIAAILTLSTKKKRSKYKYLFNNLVKCEECGHWMVRKSTLKKNGDVFKYYYCGSCKYRVNENKILDLYLQNYGEIQKEDMTKIVKDIEKMIEKKKKRKNIIAELYEEGEISQKDYKEDYKKVNKEIEDLEKRRKRIIKEKEKRFKSLDYTEKCTLIRSQINYVKVSKTDVFGDNRIKIEFEEYNEKSHM